MIDGLSPINTPVAATVYRTTSAQIGNTQSMLYNNLHETIARAAIIRYAHTCMTTGYLAAQTKRQQKNKQYLQIKSPNDNGENFAHSAKDTDRLR